MDEEIVSSGDIPRLTLVDVESSSGTVNQDIIVTLKPTPKPKRQRFVATLPSDITQNDFQARLNGLGDPSLPVKAIWRAFLKNGAVSIRLKKA